MFRNHLTIAWRNIVKGKMYSAIKIGGFALGIAACLLIALFIRHELSYDQHYPDGGRIFRVVRTNIYEGEVYRGVHSESPLAAALKEDYPEIEKAGSYLSSELFGAGNAQIRRADRKESLYEEGVAYADQDLLEILQISMLYGNLENALTEPKTVVISRSKAEKYFGDENPVGKFLVFNNNEDQTYRITGVMEDFPDNSHLHFDFFLTLKEADFYQGWNAQNYPTYIMVKRGTDVKQLEKKLSGLVKEYIQPVMISYGNPDAEKISDIFWFELQAVKDIYLQPEVGDGLSHGDRRFIWLFAAIAFFILLLAGINFVNLSTAKSANRAKEVGLRKTIGSGRGTLIQQFLLESLLYSFISFGIGILLASLLMPWFNALAGKSLSIPFSAWWFFPLLIFAAFLTGILAGSYPSFYLSKFQPISVLKGSLSKGSKGSAMRSVLVVFQFTTSIILIIGTLIIYQQMNYILNKKIGFDKDQVLLLHGTHTLGDKVQTLKEALLQFSDTKSVSVSDYLPVSGTKRNGNTFNVNVEGNVLREPAQIWRVDQDYIQTMGMKILQGRDFSSEIASDSSAMIINETMAKNLNISLPFDPHIKNGDKWNVIGIVQDFHFENLKDDIRSICLVLGNSPGIMSVKVNTADMPVFLHSVKELWDDFAPDQPIRYSFLDDNYARMYEDVQRMGHIFTSFAMLAIIVACLGLFALASFMTEQRAKEISVRLVLGASFRTVYRLLTLDFLKLVGISLLLASPIAWFMMQRWLEDFAYRIEIGWEVFLLAGVLAAGIALLTISTQSVRAALRNPAESLRT